MDKVLLFMTSIMLLLIFSVVYIISEAEHKDREYQTACENAKGIAIFTEDTSYCFRADAKIDITVP